MRGRWLITLVVLIGVGLPVAQAAPAVAAGDDVVRTHGFVSHHGSTQGQDLNAGVVDIAGVPDGDGYWLLGFDGGVFSFGSAAFWGSMGDQPLNAPIIGIEPTPTGKGYWLFAGDGGIFSFGDAHFFGSTGDIPLNSPIVDMIATPDGNGYWLIAADGGVFAFGQAAFWGSAGGIALQSAVVAGEVAPDGNGYWLISADAGVFTYGSATFFGSGAGLSDAVAVGIESTVGGDGYWIAFADGTVHEFGSAEHFGDAADTLPPDAVVVAIEAPWDLGYRLLLGEEAGVVPLLGPGDTGPAVASLQTQLLTMGYWLGSADGSYGLLTTQAVTAFQKANGLERTGRVDGPTQIALLSATRPVPRSTSGYVIEVDKARQLVIVARDGYAEWILNTSTGTERPYVFEGTTYLADTPPGEWTVTWQVDGIRTGELGTLIRPKYFHPDGIAFHGYPSVPSYPASHGCVRLTMAAIDWVWEQNVIPLGTKVSVYP